MRKFSALFILLLTACVPQYQSIHDQIVQQCTEAGYKDKELNDCISVATSTYNKELEKQQEEDAKEFERQRKETIRIQKEAKQQQLNADGTICKNYGIRKGTKDFALCMMQIETSRQQAEQRRQESEAQKQILTQKLQEVEQQNARQRAWQSLQELAKTYDDNRNQEFINKAWATNPAYAACRYQGNCQAYQNNSTHTKCRVIFNELECNTY